MEILVQYPKQITETCHSPYSIKYLTTNLQISDVQLTESRQRKFPARSLVFYLSLKHRMLSAGCMDKHETRLNLTAAKCTNTLHGLAPTLRALHATFTTGTCNLITSMKELGLRVKVSLIA